VPQNVDLASTTSLGRVAHAWCASGSNQRPRAAPRAGSGRRGAGRSDNCAPHGGAAALCRSL